MSRMSFALILTVIFALGAGTSRFTTALPAVASDSVQPNLAALQRTTQDLQDRMMKLENRNAASLTTMPTSDVSSEDFIKQKLHIAEMQRSLDALSARVTKDESLPKTGGGSQNGDQALLGVNALTGNVKSISMKLFQLQASLADAQLRITSTQNALISHNHCFNYSIGIMPAVVDITDNGNQETVHHKPFLTHDGLENLSTMPAGTGNCKQGFLAPMKLGADPMIVDPPQAH